MMAWSLSKEDRAKVCAQFLSLDTDNQGTISVEELKAAMAGTLRIPDQEVQRAFAALDANGDKEICYSEFLAAMVSTKIDLNDELLHSTFQRFDASSCGYITVEGLQDLLGDTFDGERMEALIREAGQASDRKISYPEFAAYLRGTPAAVEVVSEARPLALEAVPVPRTAVEAVSEVRPPALEEVPVLMTPPGRAGRTPGWQGSIHHAIAGLRAAFSAA